MVQTARGQAAQNKYLLADLLEHLEKMLIIFGSKGFLSSSMNMNFKYRLIGQQVSPWAHTFLFNHNI